MNSLTASAADEQQPSPTPPARQLRLPSSSPPRELSRYENQKRRDWNTFCQHRLLLTGQDRPGQGPVPLPQCNGSHVIEFLRYLDQFGKTTIHCPECPFYGRPSQPVPCSCPLRQAWGSLDSMVGRLRAAFEENGGSPLSNPFASGEVRDYLRELREVQSKARGICYDKKHKKRPNTKKRPTLRSESRRPPTQPPPHPPFRRRLSPGVPAASSSLKLEEDSTMT